MRGNTWNSNQKNIKEGIARYGYYTLPIIYGDRFVGRIEAVPDRKEGILQVKGLWWEPEVRQTKALNRELERALGCFAKFNDCKSFQK